MSGVVISGTGLHCPPESISNEELVESFNRFVRDHNATHRDAIAAGERAPLEESSAAFILKASGIAARYVVDRAGILDTQRMIPRLRPREQEEPGLLCEMARAAAEEALAQAGREPAEVDLVIAACSNPERAYPAVAVELQHALGCGGSAYDMNVACSSATFGLRNAADALQAGSARCVLMVNPEVCTGHLNFRDRDSHFIFGDACTAVVLEPAAAARAPEQWELLGTRLETRFSHAIRNDFGFLQRTRCERGERPPEQLFVQQGRKVFREVVPLVHKLIAAQLAELELEPVAVRRFWLHQANLSMNRLILKRLLGAEASRDLAPVVLDEFGNTSSAGSIIAFHRHRADLAPGDLGVICSFGAGYSAGSVVVRKRALGEG